MSVDKRKQFETIFEKFQKLLPLLASPVTGEADNARLKINALLAKAGLDWHDVLTLMSPQQESLLEMLMRLMEKETDALVRLARAGATFFCSNKKVAFADVRIGNHCLTMPLTSRDFSEWVAHEYYKETKKAAKLMSEKDAIRALSAFAKYEGERHDVYLRAAHIGGTLYLDIGDETGRAIEVTADGWQVLFTSPVKFQRTAGMAALPIPERGEDIKALRRFVNVSDSNFILYVATLTDALFPGRPHPVLNFIGDSGTGKTTMARIVRALTDPSDVPAGTLPREPRDLFADVNGSHVLFYDNISTIPPLISDTLCQITSGTGFRKRKLYTDLDQVLIGGYRTVVLTGLHNAVTAADLAERCVTMGLSHITARERRSETRLWREFNRECPEIFGALLDIVAHGLKHLAHAQVPDLPRLSDLALWGTAIEGATNGAFIRAFNVSQAIATDATVDVNPVAHAVSAFMEDRASAWDGTTTQLWRELQRHDQAEARPTETKDWPHEPIAFGIALSKATPILRKIGIEVTRDRNTSRLRTPMVHLRKIEPTTGQTDTAAAMSEMSETSERPRQEAGRAVIVPFSR